MATSRSNGAVRGEATTLALTRIPSSSDSFKVLKSTKSSEILAGKASVGNNFHAFMHSIFVQNLF
jgi:hypothetical protein